MLNYDGLNERLNAELAEARTIQAAHDVEMTARYGPPDPFHGLRSHPRATPPDTRQASRGDYVLWLRGYMLSGGKPTHVYNYPFNEARNMFFVAIRDFYVYPFYGSMSNSIIVPRNIRFLGGELGHHDLYFEEGNRTTGGIVPIYTDIKF